MCIMNTILKISGDNQMKKIDPALLNFETTEDQFLLTQKEAEMLSSGELTFHNGMLYRTENFFPQEVPVLDLTPEDGILLNLYGSDKQCPALQDLTIGTGEWRQENQGYNFSRPSQAQIERCKQFPPVEIKGVHLKDSKLHPDSQEAVKQLIKSIQVNGGKHPYTWVEEAQMLVEFSGEEVRPILLEILNNAIPLKEGMKLEGFSASEFEQKYFYSRPSLLEQAESELVRVEHGYKPTLNMIDAKTHENLGPLNLSAEDLVPRPIDMDNLVVEDPIYLSVGVEGLSKVSADTKELEQALKELYYNGNYRLLAFHFIECAAMVYGEYKGHIHMLDSDDPDPELTKWSIAIHLQDKYWESFRGKTITILKLFNKFLNPDNKLYHLETPIIGMKKR